MGQAGALSKLNLMMFEIEARLVSYYVRVGPELPVRYKVLMSGALRPKLFSL